jgi:ubiquinone/menaquinone biosynthesis C-methylase UbiE
MTRPQDGWDAAYAGDAPAPWDIGRPQPIFATLAAQGRFAGDLLDCGCGTGEHALLAAAGGAKVLGVDLAAGAVERARQKAVDRGLSARFEAGDVLTMPLPDAGFDVVIDSGLFHSFDDADRERYVDVLRRVTRVGAAVYLACFSDRQPGDWGPRRVTRSELVDAFSDGWSIESIEPVTFVINPVMDTTEVQAWLLVARRSHGS